MGNNHQEQACSTIATTIIRRRSATRTVARRTRSVCRRFNLPGERSKLCPRAQKLLANRSSSNRSQHRLLSNLSRRTICAITITTWPKFLQMETYSTFRLLLSKNINNNNSSTSRLSLRTINLYHPRRRLPQQYSSISNISTISNNSSSFIITFSNSSFLVDPTVKMRRGRPQLY